MVGNSGNMSTRSILTINCHALAENYRQIQQIVGAGVHVAGVVKADGYGIGMSAMAQTLYHAGCRVFYTAQLSEAIALRRIISDGKILVFEGPVGDMDAYHTHDLTPVINSLSQLQLFRETAATSEGRLPPFHIHIDTGMARLGLSAEDVASVSWADLPLAGIISHLASADIKAAQQNRDQLARLHAIIKTLPDVPVSFANSGGIFLGPDFHFHEVRPGLALHGFTACAEDRATSGLQPILRWDAPIIQIRTLKAGDTIGYGASFTANKDMRVATIGAGYADGYRRQLQGKGRIDIGGHITTPVGRISMDLLVVDVTNIPSERLFQAGTACLLGPHYSIEEMAADLDTIAYEVLTGLGDRIYRAYDGLPDVACNEQHDARER